MSAGNGKFHYFLQDHQGNNRVVLSQDGTVEEVNHYYPFGGLFATANSVQPYKYNGKELDTKAGLYWHDYGARQYDATLGRWHVVDPMAEKYFRESPYGYCGNNPVVFIDPNGQMRVIYNPDGTYSKTTHNNWFHNFFIGREEYIDYGDRMVQLSEEEFWLWQSTGKYDMIKSLDSFISNLEFDLKEPVPDFITGIEKFIKSSAYSLINSPKIWLTGKTWAGTYVTPDERAAGFIDVASTWLPTSKLIKGTKPISYYKFKNQNSQIPIKNKKNAYNTELKKYEIKSQSHQTFENLKNSINAIQYMYNETTNKK